MRKGTLTQKQLAFYKLYIAYKAEPGKYVAAWEFVGEILVKELDKWCLMSYKTPANGLAIYSENPGLIERRKVRGKSGALYYEYRIAANPSVDKIKDPDLLSFYRKISGNKAPSKIHMTDAEADRIFNSM